MTRRRSALLDRRPLTGTAKQVLRQSGRDVRVGNLVSRREVLLRLLALQPPDPAAALFESLGTDTAAASARVAAGRQDARGVLRDQLRGRDD
jgi:hypothetical protein